jgi:SAM-dependent methyltransferase
MRRLLKRFVGPAYFRARRYVNRLVIERRLGIETAQEVGLGEFGLDAADRRGYEPSGWLDLQRILGKDEVSEEDVFIDFGSGKGRVVLAAARYPFRRVIGVELSEQLNRIARANVEHVRSRVVCRDIELVTADAVDYEIPDDVTVAYFYNPFGGPVFATVIEGLLESVDRNPRLLRIIYRTPLEDAYLEQSGRLKRVKTRKGMRPGRQWRHTSSISMYIALPSSFQPAPSVAADRAISDR